MAYRIDYGPVTPQKGTGGNSILRLQMLMAVFLLLFTFLVSRTWTEGTEKLRAYLLPGAGAAQTAVQELVEDLSNGEPMEEALTAFCRQIIQNGQKASD